MTELLRTTVGKLLDEVTSRFPENEVLVDLPKGQRYTYRRFLDRVNQLAKGFLKLGIEKGDHVALCAPNVSEWIITEFAVAKIGAVLISVDTNAQLQQLEYLLRQSDSKCLVMTEGMKGTEYVDILRQLCPEIKDSSTGQLKCKALPELKNVILISDRTYPGMLNWKKILEMGKDILNQGGPVPDEDAGVLLILSHTGKTCAASGHAFVKVKPFRLQVRQGGVGKENILCSPCRWVLGPGFV